jgi:acetyl-CoA carboxylase biotin carboxyl carrier protein
LDLKELKQILQMLDEEQITEFELETDAMKLRIKKSSASQASAPQEILAPSAPALVARPPAPPPEASNLHIVKSPIVGTFYRAAEPTGAPFVSVGDRVKPGQVLCIVEAMKLMNEIEAEIAGEVVKIHHEAGQPVQYGDPLFTLRPEA